MCGAYTVAKHMKELGCFQSLIGWSEVRLPVYKASPSEQLPVVLDREPDRVRMVKWGFKPDWTTAKSRLLINARAETVNQKPAFKDAFRNRRCLIIADGFYEWQASPAGKLPLRITLRDGQPFAFAGLWQEIEGVPTYTIITTRPNDVVRPIHERMPVVLTEEEHEQWLDPSLSVGARLLLLDPHPSAEMTAYRVSKAVNRPITFGPELIESLKVVEVPTLFD